jgi:ribosome assembly protein 4
MATLLPPPKRAKIYHENSQVQAPPVAPVQPAPTIVVQFVSEDDGETPIGPAVNLPADFSREGLEALVNKQSGQVGHLFLTFPTWILLIIIHNLPQKMS